MNNIEFDARISLRNERCSDCGNYYAVEARVGWVRCPVCAKDRIAKLIGDGHAKDRTISALRGTVTRLISLAKRRTTK